MATEDSRHNFKLPRWASDASGVASGNETEPPSQQKDDGWIPGVDSINGRWWNWLHQQAYYWFSYAENLWDRRWTIAHLMRSAAGTNAGEVTAGTGLAVDVVAARVWIDGAMYLVPAATDLALAAADPTDDRYDLVIARLNGGVPEYAVLTGTPDPAPAEPAPTTSQVPLARVRVNAAASAPSSIADRRRRGVLEVDTLEASLDFDVGNNGRTISVRDNEGTNSVINVLKGALSGVSTINVADLLVWFVETGPLSLANLVGDLILPAGQIEFATPITRKFDIPAHGFSLRTGGSLLGAFGAGSPTVSAGIWALTSGSNSVITAAVHVPAGATITAVRVYGTKTTTDAYVRLRLFRTPKGSTTATILAEDDNNGSATGDFTLAVTGVGHTSGGLSTYVLEVQLNANTGDVEVWAAEVEYTETRPFDGL